MERKYINKIIADKKIKKPIIILSITIIIFLYACTIAQTQNQNTQFRSKLSQGEVSIELTPKTFENSIFTISYSLNTHSVDLSKINLQSQTTLYLGNIKYSPINNPQLSGHHNSGELKFNLPKTPTKFKIIIENIPDIKQRIFGWP